MSSKKKVKAKKIQEKADHKEAIAKMSVAQHMEYLAAISNNKKKKSNFSAHPYVKGKYYRFGKNQQRYLAINTGTLIRVEHEDAKSS